MCLFISKKIVSTTFFTDNCARNFFFTRESVYFHSMDCFLTQTCNGKPIFSPFIKIFWLRYASLYTTHSSVNFAWFTLLKQNIWWQNFVPAWVEKQVHEVKIHWFFCKENPFGQEKNHHHRFLEKGVTVNRASYSQRLWKNSPYLLNQINPWI